MSAHRVRMCWRGALGPAAFVVATLFAMSVLATSVLAQPTPGNAPGSQTGDGGGGYTGLSSAPQANLFTGAAEASIPIEVPPGRLGMAPALALSYSSSAGASAYGYGWALPLPRISRSTKRGMPRFDDSDEFVLVMPGGAIELEPVPGSTRGFRAKIESTFPRIGFQRTQNYWKVIDKGGTTFTFGSKPAARMGRNDAASETAAWLLERIEDPAGNLIEITYRTENSGLSSGLPSLIRYGGNERQQVSHFAEARFEWTAPAYPSVVPVSYRSGVAERIDVLLSGIDTYTRGIHARRYDFSHDIDPVTGDARLAGATLTAFGEDTGGDVRLPSTVFLYGDTLSKGWATGAEGHAQSIEITDMGPIHYGKPLTVMDTLDLNGDNIVDYIDVTARPATVRLGTGSGFAEEIPWNWPGPPRLPNGPTYIRKSDGDKNLETNVFDLDGDGFADVVDTRVAACGASLGSWCVWRGSASGFAQNATLWPSPGERLRTMARSGSRVVADLVDVDADGRLDYVDASRFDSATNRYWRVYRNDGAGFAATPVSFAAPLPYLARSSAGGMVYGLVDLNGDSLPDMVSAGSDEVGDGNVTWGLYRPWRVHFHTGRGLASQPTEWPMEDRQRRLPSTISLNTTDRSTVIELLDVTGDGRPDLVRRNRPEDFYEERIPANCGQRSCEFSEEDDPAVARSFCCHNLMVYVNTGSSFSEPIAWEYPSAGIRASYEECPLDWVTCQSGYLYDYDLFDFNGDGLIDLVQRGGPGDDFYTWRVFLHPSTPRAGQAPGDTHTRPNLLVAMLNGVGGETLLSYAPAAVAADTRIPFPFWTVRDRELRDGIYDGAPVRTSISYRGGRYDAEDRELRGFSMVWEVDGAGLTRVREFEQDDRRKGRLRRLSLLARPSCQPTDPEDPDDPCSPWRFLVGTDEYQWSTAGPVWLESETRTPHVNAAAVDAISTTITYDYDDLGNEVSRTTQTPLAAMTTVATEYERRIQDKPGGMPDVYTVNKPSHVSMHEDGKSSPLLERLFEYDWDGPAIGVLTASSVCLSWDATRCIRWSTRRFTHDGFGNVIAATSATGQFTRTVYDDLGVFALRSEEADRGVTTSAYDPRSGKATKTVTPNGTVLESRHDGLGRLLSTWGPGTSKSDPLGTNSYVPGATTAGPPRLIARRKGTPAVASYFDGLGREVGRKTLAKENGVLVGVVAGLKRYDARGQVDREAVPFSIADTDVGTLSQTIEDAPAWMTYGYDNAGRLTETTFPNGERVRSIRTTPGILVSHDANVVRGSAPGAVTIEFFDGLERRIQRDTCSKKPTATKPYDCPGSTLKRRESWFHDGLGRVTESRVTGLDGARADAVTTIAYDGLGNRIRVSNGNTGAWSFEHDADGRLIAVIRPDGRRITSSYDRYGRLYRRISARGRTGYRYYTSGGGRGKVRRISTRTAESRIRRDFEYDDRGRLTLEGWSVVARGDTPKRWLTRYGYDELDRRVSVEHPLAGDAGQAIVTTYNELGQATTIASEHQTYVADSAYDIHGRLTRLDLGNGLSDRFEYEPWSNAARGNGTLRCLRTTSASMPGAACDNAAGDLEALWYRSSDPNGNLLLVEDLAHARAEKAYDTRSYAYSAVGRLQSVTHGDGTIETFDFDSLGNLVGNSQTELRYDMPARPNQVSSIVTGSGSVAVEHDVNGSRSRAGETSYRYDDSQRLIEVWTGDALAARYGYDDTGARLYSYDGIADSFRYEFGAGVAVEEKTVEISVPFGGRMVAVARFQNAGGGVAPGGRTLFLHSDHQATPRLITDAAGNPVERARYRAYGERRATFDEEGRQIDEPLTRYAYTGQLEDKAADLVYFGARYYDPTTGAFLTLDPEFQFTSPYAYSDGNPVLGRDADGSVFELTAIEIAIILTGTATFIDSIVRTGDLGHSLTAGVTAGFSVMVTSQLSAAMIKPAGTGGSVWLQNATAVASQGFQIGQAIQSIEDGRYASGILAAGLTAASLIGIESANDPGPGETDAQRYDRHGIVDRGVVNGKRTIDVSGICATRPGCTSNFFTALKENLAILFKGEGGCVGGCGEVKGITTKALNQSKPVLLRCNSYGAVKCLRVLQDLHRSPASNGVTEDQLTKLSAELTGAPILRPPVIKSVTYHANLFDPVVWVGTAFSIPFRSDVVLGRNWWVPTPLLVHHDSFYHKPVHQILGELGQ